MQERQRFSFPILNIPASSWLVMVLLLLTAIIYIPVFNNLFTNWDDDLYILGNPYLKSLSFENLKNIFTVYYAGNYHPLTLFSLAFDFMLGGSRPWPYQLTNLLLHLCNTLLVYIFIKSLLQKYSTVSKHYSAIALITAGLFGIHTFQVESVAWISERKNILYTFFFFLSLIAYVRYLENKSLRIYVLSIALFVLSLLSKGTAITLSICIVAIDYLSGRKLLSQKVILEKIPYIALSLIFGFIAIKAQHSADAIGVPDNFTVLDRIAIASYGLIHYLLKLFFPYNLSAFYPYPVKTGPLLSFQFYGCIGLVILLQYASWKFFRHNKIVIFGILFFIANISIVIQLLPVGGAIMADRYVYIPSVGFFLLVGYLSICLWEKSSILRNSVITVLALYVAILSAKSYQRVSVWKDSLILWNDAIKKYPENNTRGYLNRASALYYLNNYPQALQDYKKLLQIDPRNGGAYIGTGLIKQATNDIQGAMSDYNTALSFGQLYQGYFNRAALKTNLKDFQGALADLDKTLQVNASKAEVYINKGFNLYQIGNYIEALENYNLALQIDQQESKAYQGRGQVKQAMNDPEGAMEDYNAALSISPSYDYYLNRASLKYILNDSEGALTDLDNAIKLNTSGYEAIFDKGFVELHLGNMPNAIKEFDKAIVINPNDFEVYLNRAIAKYHIAEYHDAMADLDQSIQLKPNASAFYYRGMTNLRLGQKSGACKDLKQSALMGDTIAKLEIERNCN